MEVIEWTPYILDSLFLVEQAHPWQLSYTDELESYYQEKSNIEKWDLASWFLLISYMGAKCANLSNNFIYLNDTSTWPKPPCKGSCTEWLPSRLKPAQRWEKSLYDEAWWEWRISPENRSPWHQELHWDYKASPKSKWENIDINWNIL